MSKRSFLLGVAVSAAFFAGYNVLATTGQEITAFIKDDYSITVDDIPVKLPDGMRILNYVDHTYTPARLIAEAMGGEVKWDEPTKTIKITKPKPKVVEKIVEKTPDVSSKKLDDYLGLYTDQSYNEVDIKKDGDAYSMRVSIYRLATFDTGTVSITNDGVVFDTTDPNEKPIKFLFYKNTENKYAFKVLDSTWGLLENGTVFEDMIKTTNQESNKTNEQTTPTVTPQKKIQYQSVPLKLIKGDSEDSYFMINITGVSVHDNLTYVYLDVENKTGDKVLLDLDNIKIKTENEEYTPESVPTDWLGNDIDLDKKLEGGTMIFKSIGENKEITLSIPVKSTTAGGYSENFDFNVKID